ncbi:hypothetical protein KI387_013125, partial [Taxus chinensis]
VDQAMARLQEIQCTISGGSKLCGGVALSPRSTRGYLRTSMRCKQESVRMKELALMVDEETNPDQGRHIQRSSSLRRSSSNGEWRRWSMPAFLIQQAVGEIMEASNSAKEVAHFLSKSIETKPTESSPISAQTGFKQNSLDDWCKDAYDRKIEKKEYSARVPAESPKLGMRLQGKMSFRAFDQVKKQGMERSLPVSCCSSPVMFINDKTTFAKPLVKVEHIGPAHEVWISRSSSTKAIMFPNTGFVSSPLNYPEVRSTDTSMKRKLVPSVKDLTSLRVTDYPCHKEEESGVCTIVGSTKLRKSLSFSAAYKPNASKLTKQSPMSSLLNRTLKKFHVVKASTSVTSKTPSKHDTKTKFEVTPFLEKTESLRLISSSHVQGFMGRRHSISSYDQCADCRVSQLSKQPMKTLIQPPKKRNSVVANESFVMEEGHRKTDSMFSETSKREVSASPAAEEVGKQGAYWIEDRCMQSSVPIMENISVNEMNSEGHVQECNSPIFFSEERILRPVSMKYALDTYGRHVSNTDASKNRQIKLQRKEKRDNCKEDGGKSGFLRKSCSLRREEKLHNSTGGLPFLKNVKEWVKEWKQHHLK